MLLARLAGVVALVFAVVAIIALHSTGKQRLADHIAAPMRTHTTSPKPTRHRNRAAKPRREHVVKHRMRSAHSAHGSTQPVVVTVAPGGAGGSTRRSSGPAHSPRTRPRAASKVKVGGDVTCLSGRSVEGVWVQASAHSGYAPWQGVTVPGKKFGSTSKWWWWLPAGASYSLHVGCGGTQANWAVAAYTPTVSGTSNSFDCEDLPSQAGYAKCYRI